MMVEAYICGMILSVTTSFLLSAILKIHENWRVWFIVGALIGFCSFLIGLVVLTKVGNIYVNAGLSSLILTVLSRNSWRHL